MRFRRPSPALVVACMALFISLSGIGTAALLITSKNIKDSTIKSRDIGRNQVKGVDVAEASLGQVPLAGSAANAGMLDGIDSGAFRTTALRSGESMTGVWGYGWDPDAAGESAPGYFTFPTPVAAKIDKNHVVYVAGASAPNCPGVRTAAPGYLCVYQRIVEWIETPDSADIHDPEDQSNIDGVSRYGFAILLTSENPNPAWISGTYTYTAP
ncbi:MAG: hypothetical protein WD027_07555 [Gaiellales bacterium]